MFKDDQLQRTTPEMHKGCLGSIPTGQKRETITDKTEQLIEVLNETNAYCQRIGGRIFGPRPEECENAGRPVRDGIEFNLEIALEKAKAIRTDLTKILENI